MKRTTVFADEEDLAILKYATDQPSPRSARDALDDASAEKVAAYQLTKGPGR